MKELVRHIEILLLDHDCVVVPQVGAFVTCNAPAKYIEEENLFLPPIRTVGFNERLKADDGLLVKSYVSVYHCSEAEAKSMLGEQIRDLQQELWENGVYDLGSIGVLSQDEDSNVQFSPCQAGTVCPAYYGLDGLNFATLAQEVAEETVAPASAHGVTGGAFQENAAEEKSPEYSVDIRIRLKRTWITNVAAVAAAVLLFFFISPEAENTRSTTTHQAEFTQLMWLPTVQYNDKKQSTKNDVKQPVEQGNKDKDKKPAAQKKDDNKKNDNKKADNKKSDSNKNTSTSSKQSGYCVVVASAISEKNANSYVEKLHQKGFTDAQVYKSGNMVRVVFPGYSTESEAREKLKKLKAQLAEFASAWVYLIK